MTNKITEARRKLFEAFLSRRMGSKYLPGLDNRRDKKGDYIYEPAASYWLAFNAGLDAVEIVLPDCDPGEVIPYGLAIDDCRAAIESTNLGLRVK